MSEPTALDSTLITPDQDDPPWPAVTRLVERLDAPTIVAHRLAPLAADRWEELRRAVPQAFVRERRAAQLLPLLAGTVLARARDAYPGRMLVVKGPEIAAVYPANRRFYGDLDLLVDDAPGALDALIAAGFETVDAGSERRPHHLPPVWWPGIHLPIEIHTHLNWPKHLVPPTNAEVFAEAVPSRLGIDGLETAAPAHQAILTAAHCWKHVPLRSVGDLIDVSVLAQQADADEIRRLAHRWGMSRIWHTTTAAADWMFEDRRRPVATRLWAQSLRRPREATILERHVRRWVTPFWALPPHRATVATARNIVDDLQPVDGEGWSAKLRRSIWVASHPSRTRSGLAREDADDAF